MEIMEKANQGNTNTDSHHTSLAKQRQIPADKWAFTLNNYTETNYIELKEKFNLLSNWWVIGKEKGESGTPHLQGYVEFNVKTRPIEKIGIKAIHWEEAGKKVKNKDKNKIREYNFNYCTKDRNFEMSDCFKDSEFWCELPTIKIWQSMILNQIIDKEPDPRSIMWVIGRKGGEGKTTFAKYLCQRYKALYVGGKANDVKFAIASMEVKPKIVIWDLARSLEDYVSYEGLEAIKNGIFFSNKYESGMVMYKIPHVIVFANFEPKIEKLTLDRWNIIDLDYMNLDD